MASLEEYIANYRQFFQDYPPFKDAFGLCIKKLDSKADLSEQDYDALRNALQKIMLHVTDHELPSFAKKEEKSAYRLLRRVKDKNRGGDLTDMMLFEHYDDIVRSNILKIDDYFASDNCAEYAFWRIRKNFETLTEECYGKVKNFRNTGTMHFPT